jgi:hypothetical protein
VFLSLLCCSLNALLSVILRRYNLRSNIYSNLRKYNYSMFCILASISVATSRLSIDGKRHLSTLIYGHPAVQIPSISVVLRARASDRFSLGLTTHGLHVSHTLPNVALKKPKLGLQTRLNQPITHLPQQPPTPCLHTYRLPYNHQSTYQIITIPQTCSLTNPMANKSQNQHACSFSAQKHSPPTSPDNRPNKRPGTF